MKPIDLRNANFADLKPLLTAQREAVHRTWLAHGPGTTREVATRAGMDLLSFRPRSTELFQLGLLALDGHAGHDGIYAARDLAAWEEYLAAQRPAVSGQQNLALN